MPEIPDSVFSFLAALGSVVAVCAVAWILIFIAYWLMELVDYATGDREDDWE